MKQSNLFSAVSFVRNRRLATALLTGALAMGLLLGASTAQAQTTVETDHNGNVTRILNLSVTEFNGPTKDWDVDFIFGPVTSVYPNGEADFPFTTEPDKIAANIQVKAALNAAIPVPPLASDPMDWPGPVLFAYRRGQRGHHLPLQ